MICSQSQSVYNLLNIISSEEEDQIAKRMKEEKLMTERERRHLEDLLNEVRSFYSSSNLYCCSLASLLESGV